MKKCDFCEHREYISNGEPVCRKRLLFLDGYKPEEPCSDFTIPIRGITLTLVAMIAAAVLFTLLLCGV